MHEATFLKDLAIVMSVAALATLIFRQLKQPVVLGYILAGVIIGPNTPPFALIEDEHAIETLAELGIIFLMFALGLEFSLPKLKKVATAFIAASFEIVLMILAGYGLVFSLAGVKWIAFSWAPSSRFLRRRSSSSPRRFGQNARAFCQPYLRHPYR